MHTIRDDPEELAGLIRSISGVSVISVDGHVEAGKTHLAKALADALGAAHIDLDPFVEEKRRVFIPALQVPELAEAMNQARSNGMVIVSGVCVLAALGAIKVRPDIKVYVERRTQADIPGDLDIIDAEERGDIDHLNDRLFTDLDREIGRYHLDYRPRSTADVVYLRSEKASC